MGLARLAADRQHGGIVAQRDGAPPQVRIAEEDQLPGAELMLVVADGEAHAAAQHDVELLVAVQLLGVLLDHLTARTRRVRVDAEGLDPEPAAHRPPHEPVGQLDRVELVDVRGRHPNSSRQRGSSRSGSRSVSSAAHLRTSASSICIARRSSSNAASGFPSSDSQQALL